MTAPVDTVITHQPGPQTAFITTKADIAIYGGAAGGGKTFGLLLECLRHTANPLFRALVFRRTTPQIRNEGGLWETSQELYPLVGAKGFSHSLRWKFPSGATVRFAHMEHEKTKTTYQGSQIPLICFDELTHFSETQFWYMMLRNRSASGVAGYIRATCNPDPDSWVRKFIAWWIGKDGFPIPGRAGVLRWFHRAKDDVLHWAFEPEELIAKFGPDCKPKSVTFIPAKVTDNPILLKTDPSYLANLQQMTSVERQQMLDGNWDVRAAAGSYFKRGWFKLVKAAPAEVVSRVRFWDRAATEQFKGNDPDATAGLKLSKDATGMYFIEHVERMFASPRKVDLAMLNCAKADGMATTVAYAQDPGSAGVNEAQATATKLDGYSVIYKTATGDKEVRAKGISSQAEAGNVSIVVGDGPLPLWVEDLLKELENFPVGRYDDQVDALSGAHETIATGRVVLVA